MSTIKKEPKPAVPGFKKATPSVGGVAANSNAAARQMEIDFSGEFVETDIKKLSAAIDTSRTEAAEALYKVKAERRDLRRKMAGKAAKLERFLADFEAAEEDRKILLGKARQEKLRIEEALRIQSRWDRVRRDLVLRGDQVFLAPAYGKLVSMAKRAPNEFEKVKHSTLVTSVARQFRPATKTQRTFADVMAGRGKTPLPTPQGFSVGSLDDLEKFFDRFGRTKYGRDHDPRPMGRLIITQWLDGGDDATYQRLFWQYASDKFARAPRGSEFVPQGMQAVPVVFEKLSAVEPKLVLQGQTGSKPGTFPLRTETALGPMTFNIEPPNPLEVVWAALPAPLRDSSKYRMIASLVSLCYAMSAAPSFTMFATQFGAFMANHAGDLPRYMREAMQLVSLQGAVASTAGVRDPIEQADLAAVANVVAPLLHAEQSEWDAIKGIMDFDYTTAMNSSLGRSLFDLVGMVSISTLGATSGFFGNPTTSLYYLGEIKKHLRRDVSVDTFAGNCFRILTEFAKRIYECVRQGSLKPMFADERLEPEQLYKYARDLLDRTEILIGSQAMAATFAQCHARGEYSPRIFCQMTIAQKTARLRDVLPQAMVQYRLCLTSDKLRADLPRWARVIGDVQKAIAADVAAEAAAKNRAQPFGFLLWGPKGTGKSTLSNKLIDYIAMAEGLPKESGSVGNLEAGVNFQDTLYSHTWALKCDDPALVRVKPQAGVLPTCALLCKLINREAYEIEKSDVTAKGTAFASMKVVSVTSNVASLNSDVELADVDPLWRRLRLRIKVCARPEVVDANGDSINPDKAAEFGNPDVNLFYVEEYVDGAQSVFDSRPYRMVPGFDGTTDTGKVLRFVFERYQRQQAREMEWLRSVTCGKLCIACGHYHDGLCYGREEEDVPDTFEVESTESGSSSAYAPAPPRSALMEYVRGEEELARSEEEEKTWEVRMQVRKDVIVGGVVATSLGVAEPYLSSFARKNLLGLRAWEYAEFFVLLNVASTALTVGGIVTTIFGLFCEDRTLQVGHDLDKVQPFAHSIRSDFARFQREDIPLTQNTKARCENLDSLQKKMQRCVVQVAIPSMNRSMYGFFVRNDTLLVPRHLFIESVDPSTSRVSAPVDERLMYHDPVTGMVAHVDVQFGERPNAWAVPGRDLIMISVPKVNAIGYDFTDYLLSSDGAGMHMFDEVRFLHPGRYAKLVNPRMGFAAPLSGGDRGFVAMYPFKTEDGDCGVPVIARYAGTVFIAGLHVGAYVGTTDHIGFAEFIPGAAIHAGLGRLSRVDVSRQYMAAVPKSFMEKVEALEVTRPAKSSAYLMVERAQGPIFIEGTLSNSINGSTMKSKVEPLPQVGQSALLVPLLGYGPQDFGPPLFKGEMLNGEWHDTYTRFFQEVSAAVVDDDLLEEAFSLYERGLENVVGLSQVRPLSIYEAVRGIPGTGIRSVNRATSSGAPDFTKKKNLVEFEDESESVFLDQRLVAQMKEIEDLLDASIVPIPFATMGLKDEVLDSSKIERRKFRLFTVLPAAFQIAIKMRMRPLCDLFRCNRDFFECYIGFNAADVDEVSNFVNRLRYGQRLDDADYSFFDVKQSIQFAKRQALFWRKFAELAGYAPKEVQDTYLLCLGLVYTMRLVKREIVSIPGANPSGVDCTSEWNSVTNSVLIRYGVCSVKRKKGLSSLLDGDWFRQRFILATFGDDLDSSSSCDWCTFTEIAEELKPVGAVLTPGTKEGDFRPLRLEEIVFLKRKPVFCKDIGAWTMALTKKSIAKMLSWRVAGDLSLADHQSEVITAATREAFFHGKTFYVEFRSVILQIATALGVDSNPRCRIPTFEAQKADYLGRRNLKWGVSDDELKTQVWMLHSDGSVAEYVNSGPAEIATSRGGSPVAHFSVLQGGHCRISFPPMSESVQESVASHATPLEMTGPISGIEKDVAQTDDAAPASDRQLLSSSDYISSDMAERPFIVTGGQWTGADIPGSTITINNLVSIWASSRAASRLVEINQGWRMDFEVWVTFSSAATTGGFAVLSAVPYGGHTLAQLPQRDWREDLSFPHVITFFSTKPEGKLELPYFMPVGFIDVASTIMWQVRFAIHISPFADGDANPLVDYVIWARAKNVRMFNPRLQSANGVKWSQVAAKLSTLPLPPVAKGALSTASSVMGSLGYTREQEEPHSQVMVRRPVSNMSRVDGPDSSDVCAFLSSARLPTEEGVFPGEQEGELEFAALGGRWGYLGLVPLASTDTDTTIKAWIPVTPCQMIGGFGPDYTDWRTLPAGACCLPFAFWRGGFELMIVSGLASLQRASLQVFWVPQFAGVAGVSPALLSSQGTDTLHSAVFEIRAGMCYSFKVGWRSDQAAEPCIFQSIIAGTSITPTTLTTGGNNGVIIIRVVNSIAGATTSTAAVNLYARMMPDFRPIPIRAENVMRFEPGTANYVSAQARTFRAVLQVGLMDMSCVEQSYEVPAVSALSPEVFASEDIMSARALMQRFSLEGRTTEYTTAPRIGFLDIFYPVAYEPISVTSLTYSEVGFSWARWFLQLFCGARGSIRYKALAFDGTSTCLATGDVVANTINTATTTGDWAGLGGSAQFITPGNFAVEFHFPFKSDRLWRLTRVGTSTFGPNSIRARVIFQGGNGAVPAMNHYVAMGPDFQVAGYVGGLRVTFP